MRSITILFATAIFSTVCQATWNPSEAEVALSAKEDARDIALFKLMTPSADEIKLSAKEDARDLALYKLLAK
jgi:hypothetical protein